VHDCRDCEHVRLSGEPADLLAELHRLGQCPKSLRAAPGDGR
jgi:hypothetical protein